jgi:hypothetical protein
MAIKWRRGCIPPNNFTPGNRGERPADTAHSWAGFLLNRLRTKKGRAGNLMGDSSSPALFLQSSAGFEPDGGQLRTRRFHSGNRHGSAQGYAKAEKTSQEFQPPSPHKVRGGITVAGASG